MKILFTITTIIYLLSFVLFIYGFYNPQKALFWLKTNKEKTKNLSHYLNGSLFLVFFITSLIIFEFSDIKTEKQKLDAQLQAQTALEKQKQDEKNKKEYQVERNHNNKIITKEVKKLSKFTILDTLVSKNALGSLKILCEQGFCKKDYFKIANDLKQKLKKDTISYLLKGRNPSECMWAVQIYFNRNQIEKPAYELFDSFEKGDDGEYKTIQKEEFNRLEIDCE